VESELFQLFGTIQPEIPSASYRSYSQTAKQKMPAGSWAIGYGLR